MDPSGGRPALKSLNLHDIPASIAATAAVREALAKSRAAVPSLLTLMHIRSVMKSFACEAGRSVTLHET